MSKKYNNFKGELKTIPEYSELLPPMSEKAFNRLMDNIKKEGVIISPIVVDENKAILDGHARYKIAEMLDMTFKVVVKIVGSIEEGKLWIIENQTGQRSLSDAETAQLMETSGLTAEIIGKRETVKEPVSHLERLIVTGTDDEVVDMLIKVFGDNIASSAKYLGRVLPGKETAGMVILVCKRLYKDVAS